MHPYLCQERQGDSFNLVVPNTFSIHRSSSSSTSQTRGSRGGEGSYASNTRPRRIYLQELARKDPSKRPKNVPESTWNGYVKENDLLAVAIPSGRVRKPSSSKAILKDWEREAVKGVVQRMNRENADPISLETLADIVMNQIRTTKVTSPSAHRTKALEKDTVGTSYCSKLRKSLHIASQQLWDHGTGEPSSKEEKTGQGAPRISERTDCQTSQIQHSSPSKRC
jgi:hypothetical protein